MYFVCVYLQFAKISFFRVNSLTWIDERHIPPIFLDLLMQLPHVGVGLGQLHAVEVSKLCDGFQLVQEPHHTVQGQLRRLGQHKMSIFSKLDIPLVCAVSECGVNYAIKSNSTAMSTQKMDCIIHYPNYSSYRRKIIWANSESLWNVSCFSF